VDSPNFLDNPQNLLLLHSAVQSGVWPMTRRDMFEMATRLMLREENSERARTGSGVYSAEELRSPAGAALAARLIGDIEAISLADQEGTASLRWAPVTMTIQTYTNVPTQFDGARFKTKNSTIAMHTTPAKRISISCGRATDRPSRQQATRRKHTKAIA
jgi:hypothetical protein